MDLLLLALVIDLIEVVTNVVVQSLDLLEKVSVVRDHFTDPRVIVFLQIV